MVNKTWKIEEKKFLNAIEGVKIPNQKLQSVDSIILKSEDDFKKIPSGGGCYWIWTNETVSHTLHTKSIPQSFYKGEIIYNGIAKDDVKGRIKHHLLGEVDAGWSGISMDILFRKSISHRKKAMSGKKRSKVPFINGQPIRDKSQLLQLSLSKEEKNFIKSSARREFYFRNGINIFDQKHNKYKFKVYYIVGLTSLYLEFIEKKWRIDFELPKLCSYSSGR